MVKIMDDEKISILVFGAGAIGVYIGGSLTHAGHQVVFLERADSAELLKNKGISVETATKEKVLIKNPVIYTDLNEVLEKFTFDLAIVAVKSYDTDDLIQGWRGLENKLPPVLCLQNGVENEEKYRVILGETKVISGTVTTAVGKPGLGEVVVEKLRGIGIAAGHSLSAIIVSSMNAAGLKAQLYQNAAAMKWSKMLTNLLANASSAILQMTPDQIFSDEALYAIEADQLRETLDVMKLYDIPVIDLPGTPVKAMAFLIKSFPKKISRMILKNAIVKGRGDKMPSFYLDMVSGRGKSEVNYLNGAVARYGEKCGYQAKVNQTLTRILSGIVAGTLPASDFINQPEKLIKENQ